MLIYYTGIGSTPEKTIFAEDEFVRIMNENFTHRDWKNVPWILKSIQLDYKDDWVLPDDFIFFTLQDWIEYSGAQFLRLGSLA